jgi:hypothetical protein
MWAAMLAACAPSRVIIDHQNKKPTKSRQFRTSGMAASRAAAGSMDCPFPQRQMRDLILIKIADEDDSRRLNSP